MSTQAATTPFYASKKGIVTLWNDGKRRTMQVTIAPDVHTIDISSLSKDAVRTLADNVEELVVWVVEKTRATERVQHGQDLLRAYTNMSEDD